jgi:hypothetical protein
MCSVVRLFIRNASHSHFVYTSENNFVSDLNQSHEPLLLDSILITTNINK